MNEFYIYLELPPYLAQWLIDDCGGSPVHLPKLTTERRILETFLIQLPANARPNLPTSTSTAIVIPNFRYKPPMYYNYLPARAMAELADCIRSRFIIELWNDLHRNGYIGKRRDNLIYAWMEAHGIESTETNWNAIAKIYQRQYKNYLERRLYAKRAKSSNNRK